MIKTEFYELAYDPKKNRVYWKVKGFWRSVDAVPEMESDWNSVLQQTEKGFTIIADLTEMLPPPQQVAELHEKVQKTIINTGVRKVATVLSSTITKWLVESITNESGMNVFLQNFDDLADAEAWLDE